MYLDIYLGGEYTSYSSTLFLKVLFYKWYLS